MDPIIQTNNISKTYKDIQAVKDVSITIHQGEIYGFIGLNGAGKTTTIRMFLGMIHPTNGACYIKGKKVSQKNYDIWKDVGHIVETPHSYPELTVEENLHIYRRLRLIQDRKVVTNVMEKLHLARYAHIKAGNLSLGNVQRLGIAKALIHSPEILILDEPVNGLDPAGIVEIRELLQDLATQQDVTILISSHLLSEIAIIANKIGIIHEGRLMQEISTTKLNELLKQRLIINTHHNKKTISKLSEAGYSTIINKEKCIEIYDKKAVQSPDKIARLLVYEGCPPTKLTVEEENLEAYFLKIIEEKGDPIS